MKIQGKDPSSGKPLEDWGCAMAWMPVLLIENAQQSRSTGAAVESFRNEMVEANQRSQQILLKEMSDVDIASRDLGNTGVVTDKSPYNIPLNAFNKGFNVRFDEGKVSRGPIFSKNQRQSRIQP